MNYEKMFSKELYTHTYHNAESFDDNLEKCMFCGYQDSRDKLSRTNYITTTNLRGAYSLYPSPEKYA